MPFAEDQDMIQALAAKRPDQAFNIWVLHRLDDKKQLESTCLAQMAIYKLIASGSYGPDEINAMTAAYESALTEIGWVDRDDPLAEMLAKSILTVTATGERPEKLKERALHALRISRGGTA
jgi:hypothetical protein